MKPLMVTVHNDSVKLRMQVDMGGAVSVISDKTSNELWNDKQGPPLIPSQVKLCTNT